MRALHFGRNNHPPLALRMPRRCRSASDERGLAELQRHEASSEVDVVGLLSANVGVALVPSSADLPAKLRRLSVEDADLARPVCVYGVAGARAPRSQSTLLKMLRASDWSAYRA
jgi:hypothetical protein